MTQQSIPVIQHLATGEADPKRGEARRSKRSREVTVWGNQGEPRLDEDEPEEEEETHGHQYLGEEAFLLVLLRPGGLVGQPKKRFQ